MKPMGKRLLCAALIIICLGGNAAMAENTYFGKDAPEAWYQEMLVRSQMNLGNNLRLKKVIERAQAGEKVTIAAIGGSITEGAGAAKYQECYAFRVGQGFAARYGQGSGANVRFLNAGVGGTPSTFGLMRYQRDIVDRVQDDDGLPDVVIIEFAVNDYQEPSNHRCFESLVKTILAQPNEPAVILLFAVFEGGFNLQDEIKKIGYTYDLMMVSIRDGAYPLVGKEWTKQDFFFDQYHPTSLGHAAMADCVLAAIEAANARESSETDVDLNVKPAYGDTFVGLKTIYGSGDYPEIGLDRGGFAHDDRQSYSNLPVGRVCGRNFCHDTTDSNEPLRFTAVFKNLLIAWRGTGDDRYGTAEILVDGKVVRTLSGRKDQWGQSEVILPFQEKEAREHTVEIRMAEDSLNKRFTITCIGYTP